MPSKAPVVLDVLNFVKNLHHMWRAYGAYDSVCMPSLSFPPTTTTCTCAARYVDMHFFFWVGLATGNWSFAFKDYHALNFTGRIDDASTAAMMEIVDPYVSCWYSKNP